MPVTHSSVGVCPGVCAAVRTDGGVCLVKLPSASSASFVLRFLETVCLHLQGDNLFSSQPFRTYQSGIASAWSSPLSMALISMVLVSMVLVSMVLHCVPVSDG